MTNEQIYTIPDSYPERTRLRKLISGFVAGKSLVPPLSMDSLSGLSGQLIAGHSLDDSLKGWMMVEIHNCVWQETVASIPHEKRLLLLPKCLSNSDRCKAEIDELGLLCHQCGHCRIPGLQDKADDLGMMSMVAEGFTSVITLIENKVVDAVIGVSCLDSLEKAFPLLINNAVPGLAIPLNVSGCRNTNVDDDYVEQMLGMSSGRNIDLLDYDYLKSIIKKWFSKENLAGILSPADEQTSSVAFEWMSGDGKRWRPYLLAATWLALKGGKDIPERVQMTAVAVECFHKASLVHDDIQDNDTLRYGRQTVNAAHGVPVAINVGDILLGEGYRLLSECGDMELIKAASAAHIALCKGQGMELEWSASPVPLTMDFVLKIFCNKTVPAFDVALNMGVICAGNNRQVRDTLREYSRALGIAYQLQDDIEDYESDHPIALRPSAVLAMLCEQYPGSDFIETLLHSEDPKAFLNRRENKPLLEKAVKQVRELAGQYHKMALDVLEGITHVELKRLFFRVTQRILNN